jgi:putative peptidoglycan lipid II flippase
MSAAVLQISVVMDKGISASLSQYTQDGATVTHTSVFGYEMRYPMEEGAVARLNEAQFLYQFPLGVFAIALATAIFPALSADALEKNPQRFKAALKQGIDATLFEGLAASVGLIIVRYPAVRLLFRHGYVTAHDANLMALSLGFYAAGIWAFSLLQILNRGYYALHDTRTPLVMSVVNIALNLVVELPLVWTNLGEAGMAVGTFVSFAVQALVTLWMLDRRVGGLNLRDHALSALKMGVACALMWAACWGVEQLPIYPNAATRTAWAVQLLVLMGVGAGVYLGACKAMGISLAKTMRPRVA